MSSPSGSAASPGRSEVLVGDGYHGPAQGLRRVVDIDQAGVVGGDRDRQRAAMADDRRALVGRQPDDPLEILEAPDAVAKLPPPVAPLRGRRLGEVPGAERLGALRDGEPWGEADRTFDDARVWRKRRDRSPHPGSFAGLADRGTSTWRFCLLSAEHPGLHGLHTPLRSSYHRAGEPRSPRFGMSSSVFVGSAPTSGERVPSPVNTRIHTTWLVPMQYFRESFRKISGPGRADCPADDGCRGARVSATAPAHRTGGRSVVESRRL